MAKRPWIWRKLFKKFINVILSCLFSDSKFSLPYSIKNSGLVLLYFYPYNVQVHFLSCRAKNVNRITKPKEKILLKILGVSNLSYFPKSNWHFHCYHYTFSLLRQYFEFVILIHNSFSKYFYFEIESQLNRL